MLHILRKNASNDTHYSYFASDGAWVNYIEESGVDHGEGTSLNIFRSYLEMACLCVVSRMSGKRKH